MKQHSAILLGLGGAVLLFAVSRTEKGQAAIAVSVDAVTSTVRGIRNNNPGNIRRSSEKWQGLAPVQTDASFFQFVSMSYGVRAMARVLKNYQSKYGLNSVDEIIGRWAPPSENDTGSYIRGVSSSIGVGPDDSIDTNNQSVLFALIRAIIAHENGYVASKLVSDTAVREGIALS